MFDKIVSWDNLKDAYKRTRKAKGKHKIAAIKFEQNEVANLKALQQALINDTYQCKPYTDFEVFEPKRRLIYAPQYEDKIVQHAINNVLRDFYEPRFIYDSYACIRGKGTHRAIKAIQKHARICKRNHGNTTYFAKTDISKFFYTIDRDILKQILKKKVKCIKTLSLLNKIIDSSPNTGLPLGNLTSQLLANVYMNEIDHYIKRNLKVKHYVRYADDLFMVFKDKQEANKMLTLIREGLRTILKLDTSDRKSFIRPIHNGLVGLGMKIYATHILLLYRHKVSVLRMKCIKSIQAWLSFTSIANCYNFYKLRILKT